MILTIIFVSFKYFYGTVLEKINGKFTPSVKVHSNTYIFKHLLKYFLYRIAHSFNCCMFTGTLPIAVLILSHFTVQFQRNLMAKSLKKSVYSSTCNITHSNTHKIIPLYVCSFFQLIPLHSNPDYYCIHFQVILLYSFREN